MKKSKSTNTSIHPFPVLSKDTIDYDERIIDSYSVNVSFRKESNNEIIMVEQEIKNNNFVAKMLMENKADFVTTVSVRGGVFRITKLSGKSNIEFDSSNKFIKSVQEIKVNKIHKDSKSFVKPGIINSEELKFDWYKDSGIDDFFNGVSFIIPKNSWIADGGWYDSPPINNLFYLSVADIEDGVFKVTLEKRLEVSIQIKIELSKKMFIEINRNNKSTSRQIVIVTALTQCLSEIKDIYERVNRKVGVEGDDETLEKSEGLRRWIKNSLKMNDWTDDNFNPSEIASKYKKITLKEYKNG